jgi:hypothetical protein
MSVGFYSCTFKHYLSSCDFFECVSYNRARLVFEEQRAILNENQLAPRNLANAKAAITCQINILEKAVPNMNKLIAEKLVREALQRQAAVEAEAAVQRQAEAIIAAAKAATEKAKADAIYAVAVFGFTDAEAEAVITHINPAKGYTKNTLLALQALNRYSTMNGIRVEDAMMVLAESM